MQFLREACWFLFQKLIILFSVVTATLQILILQKQDASIPFVLTGHLASRVCQLPSHSELDKTDTSPSGNWYTVRLDATLNLSIPSKKEPQAVHFLLIALSHATVASCSQLFFVLSDPKMSILSLSVGSLFACHKLYTLLKINVNFLAFKYS